MTQPNDPIDPDPVDPDELTRSVPAPEPPAHPPTGDTPETAAAPTTPAPAVDPAAPAAPEPLPGPIVSWTPSGYDPAAPGPGPVGFAAAAGPAAAGIDIGGDVVATTWPRLIAYWLDVLIVNLLPGILSVLVIDWEGMFRDSLDAAQNPGAAPAVMTMTIEGVLLTLIGVAIGFIYFVGLWTSGGRATIGMRGLRMRLVDARTGGPLPIMAAIKRWVALGGPLPLLGLIPPLATISGLASAGLALVLLISTASDSRRQGLHDKWAGSIVTRAPSSGSGATVIGCLVLLVATAAITVLAWAFLLAQLFPIIEEYLVSIRGAVTSLTPRGVIYFDSPAALRDWFDANHATADELWVGYYRVATGVPSITWSQAVDEALCVGWIDGIRKTVDDRRFVQRFTPRRRGSTWSAVNVAKVAALTAEGRMRPEGLAAFQARTAGNTAIYGYERAAAAFSDDEVDRFQADDAAWTAWSKRAPWYRRAATHWVVSAKRPETRARRLTALIEASAAGTDVRPLGRRPAP